MTQDDVKRQAFQEITLAQKAKVILEDPLVISAIEAMKQSAWDDFSKSLINDDHARLVARIEIDVLDKFVKTLKSHLNTGKLAQETIRIQNGDARTGNH